MKTSLVNGDEYYLSDFARLLAEDGIDVAGAEPSLLRHTLHNMCLGKCREDRALLRTDTDDGESRASKFIVIGACSSAACAAAAAPGLTAASAGGLPSAAAAAALKRASGGAAALAHAAAAFADNAELSLRAAAEKAASQLRAGAAPSAAGLQALPFAAAPPAVSARCFIIRNAVRFEPDDLGLENTVSGLMDRKLGRVDGGRAVMARDEILQLLAMVQEFDPAWTLDAVTDEYAAEALLNGAGTILDTSVAGLARMHRPCSVEALLRGASPTDEETADLRRGDLVLLLPWVRHAGPGCGERNQEFGTAPVIAETPPYGSWSHTMPWNLAFGAGAPGTLAVVTNECDVFGPWAHFTSPRVAAALHAAALATEELCCAGDAMFPTVASGGRARHYCAASQPAALARYAAAQDKFAKKRDALGRLMPTAKRARRDK